MYLFVAIVVMACVIIIMHLHLTRPKPKTRADNIMEAANKIRNNATLSGVFMSYSDAIELAEDHIKNNKEL